MQSPLYTEYIDCERLEENRIDCEDYAPFEKLLQRLADSEISNEAKVYHLTSVLQLVGSRYQECHPDRPRTFDAIIEFMNDSKNNKESE
jgi:hypothetical protein